MDNYEPGKMGEEPTYEAAKTGTSAELSYDDQLISCLPERCKYICTYAEEIGFQCSSVVGPL